MRRSALIAGVVFVLAASACAPQASPTISPEDIQQTAQAAAFTMIAQTQTANPTASSVPPTETPSPTPLPTETPAASPTIEGLSTPTLTTAAQSPAGTQDPCDKALTSWQGPSVKLSVANETKPKGTITLSLWVMTDLGECGFLATQSSGPVGQYSAAAFVDGPKSYRVFGGFRISPGSWTIVVRNESIVAQGGCFPNC